MHNLDSIWHFEVIKCWNVCNFQPKPKVHKSPVGRWLEVSATQRLLICLAVGAVAVVRPRLLHLSPGHCSILFPDAQRHLVEGEGDLSEHAHRPVVTGAMVNWHIPRCSSFPARSLYWFPICSIRKCGLWYFLTAFATLSKRARWEHVLILKSLNRLALVISAIFIFSDFFPQAYHFSDICPWIPIGSQLQAQQVIFVVIGFTWATGASVNFMSELLPEDRKVQRRSASFMGFSWDFDGI